jgi:hypothetical protein
LVSFEGAESFLTPRDRSPFVAVECRQCRNGLDDGDRNSDRIAQVIIRPIRLLPHIAIDRLNLDPLNARHLELRFSG